MDTGYIYCPMPDGVTHEYDVLEIVGHVVRVSTNQTVLTLDPNVFDYRVDVTEFTPHSNSPQFANFRHEMVSKAFGSVPYFVNHPTNAVDSNFYDSSALWLSLGVSWDGGSGRFEPYIGEMRNQLGNFMIPPEPELPLFPRVGQILDVHSTVYLSEFSPTVAIPDWHSTLYVWNHVDEWENALGGTYRDCWITVLIEKTGSTPVFFEYVFAKGIGVVDVWYGPMSPDGYIRGYESVLKRVMNGKR